MSNNNTTDNTDDQLPVIENTIRKQDDDHIPPNENEPNESNINAVYTEANDDHIEPKSTTNQQNHDNDRNSTNENDDPDIPPLPPPSNHLYRNLLMGVPSTLSFAAGATALLPWAMSTFDAFIADVDEFHTPVATTGDTADVVVVDGVSVGDVDVVETVTAAITAMATNENNEADGKDVADDKVNDKNVDIDDNKNKTKEPNPNPTTQPNQNNDRNQTNENDPNVPEPPPPDHLYRNLLIGAAVGIAAPIVIAAGATAAVPWVISGLATIHASAAATAGAGAVVGAAAAATGTSIASGTNNGTIDDEGTANKNMENKHGNDDADSKTNEVICANETIMNKVSNDESNDPNPNSEPNQNNAPNQSNNINVPHVPPSHLYQNLFLGAAIGAAAPFVLAAGTTAIVASTAVGIAAASLQNVTLDDNGLNNKNNENSGGDNDDDNEIVFYE